jgi:hypothetical protein
MTDFAVLAMRVDATGMAAGEQALDSIAVKGAAAEASVTKSTTGMSKGMREVGASGKIVVKEMSGIGPAAANAANGLSRTGKQATIAAREISAARGQTANLASQFNDIAVMMAAGQNPMQLALQQGTQITQVLGQMGGGVGAVKALGGALLSMINPLSLATIGIIAFGAAAVQWFTNAGDEAKSLADRTDDLSDAFDAYKAAADLANLTTGEAAAKFGLAAINVSKYYDALANVRRMSLDQSLTATGQGMIDTVGANMNSDPRDLANVTRTSEFFGLGDNVIFGKQAKALRAEIIPLNEALYDFKYALDVDDRIAALETALASATALAEMDGKISTGEGGEQELLDTMLATLEVLNQVKATEDGASTSRLSQAQEYGGVMRKQWQDRAKYAADEITDLNRQAEMNQLIAIYGSDSATVTRARVQAERDAYKATVDSKVGAGQMADEIMEAWDNAKGVASVDMAGRITLAADEASRLADNLNIAAQRQMDAGRISTGNGRGDGMAEVRQRQRDSSGVEEYSETPEMTKQIDNILNPKASTGSKKNAYETDVTSIQRETEALLAQADAMAKLIASGGDWRRELRVLEVEQSLLTEAQRENLTVTPAMKEQIGQLADAYVDAEEKVRAAKDETDRIEDVAERGRDAMGNLFSSITEGADGAINALASLLEQIAQVQLYNGMIGLLGQTSWGSGLVSGLGSLLTPVKAAAKGDVFSGPGISAYSGQIVSQPTLFPFAEGTGLMGEAGPEAILPLTRGTDGRLGVQASGAEQSQPTEINVNVVGARGNTEIEQMVASGVTQGLATYDKRLPSRVKQINNNPRRR